LADKGKFTATLQAAGNFSECRSAAFAMLQEEKGKCTYKRCSIGSIFTPNLQGSFLATENFFHTSKVYNPFNFMLVDAKIPSECEENCLNIGL
jgi:apyrase